MCASPIFRPVRSHQYERHQPRPVPWKRPPNSFRSSESTPEPHRSPRRDAVPRMPMRSLRPLARATQSHHRFKYPLGASNIAPTPNTKANAKAKATPHRPRWMSPLHRETAAETRRTAGMTSMKATRLRRTRVNPTTSSGMGPARARSIPGPERTRCRSFPGRRRDAGLVRCRRMRASRPATRRRSRAASNRRRTL